MPSDGRVKCGSFPFMGGYPAVKSDRFSYRGGKMLPPRRTLLRVARARRELFVRGGQVLRGLVFDIMTEPKDQLRSTKGQWMGNSRGRCPIVFVDGVLAAMELPGDGGNVHWPDLIRSKPSVARC